MRHEYIHDDERPDHYAVGRNATGRGILVQVGDAAANQARGQLRHDDAARLAKSIRATLDGRLRQMTTTAWSVERIGASRIRLGVQDAHDRATSYVDMTDDAAAHCAGRIEHAITATATALAA